MGVAMCIGRDGESFIDSPCLRIGVGGEVVAGVVNRDDPISACLRGVKAFWIDRGVPADNRPFLGYKQKDSWR